MIDDFAPVALSPMETPRRLRAARSPERVSSAELDWIGAAPAGASAQARKAFAPTPYVWRPPETIPTRQWNYGRHYAHTFVSMTVAPPGVGKSSLALAEAVDMACGGGVLVGERTAAAPWSPRGWDRGRPRNRMRR